MDKNKKNGKPQNNVLYMPIFMSVGISVGMAIGAASGNIALGMCIGLSIGVGVGTMLDAQNRKKTDASGKDKEENQ